MAAYIANPITGSITPLDTVDAVFGMALQYARLLVGGANVKSRYAEFDKDRIQYGAIVADYKVRHVESNPVNPTNSAFGSAKYPQVLKLYFGDWNDRSYEVEIKDSEAYAVVDGSGSFEVLVAQIVNALNEGERLEANDNYENVFFNSDPDNAPAGVNSLIAIGNSASGIITDGYLHDNGQYEKLEFENVDTREKRDAMYDAVFTEVKNIVDDMTKDELGTNSGGFVSSADLADIRIVAPYKWLNGASVAYLSRLFNLSEADMMAKIIETPTLNVSIEDGQTQKKHDYNVILVLHKNAIGRVVRYRSEMEQFVRQRWSRWYGVELTDMYFYNQYEKAYALIVDEQTDL